MPRNQRQRRSRRIMNPPNRRNNGQNMSRITQSRNVRANPDPPSTNLITKRPFSYRIPTGTELQALKLVNSYASVFPDLVNTAIARVRIDRVQVWGLETNAEAVFLEVGKDFSRRDDPGRNHRATIACVPRLIDGGANEETVITFSGASSVLIQGVAYCRRASLPAVSSTVPSEEAPRVGTAVGCVQCTSSDACAGPKSLLSEKF